MNLTWKILFGSITALALVLSACAVDDDEDLGRVGLASEGDASDSSSSDDSRSDCDSRDSD